MIFGIGTDIVEIQRIDKVIARFGERLAQKLLSDSELEEYRQHSQPSRFLAKRFAAKEAVVKALGTGFSPTVRARHVSIFNDESGRPGVELLSLAQEFAVSRGVNTIHLSLSDERHYAVAFATAVTNENVITT